MPNYFPIGAATAADFHPTDLLGVQWRHGGIVAEFSLSSASETFLRVSFDKPCIVRLLDDMPLSTENDLGADQGLVPHHFAYRVEGAAFAGAQSETWVFLNAPAIHYRFVTGWGCMDVLSAGAPAFEIVGP